MSFYSFKRNKHLTRAKMINCPVLISFLVQIKWSDSFQALCPSCGCSSSTALPHLPPPWLVPFPTIQTHCSLMLNKVEHNVASAIKSSQPTWECVEVLK